jgi:tetratricopeptide (TPR) repeat protein
MADEVNKLIEQIEQLFKDEKYIEIIDLLPDAVLKKHTVAILYAWKARAYSRLDQADLTLKYADAAIVIDAECAPAYLAKGNGWVIKEEFDKALENYNVSIDLVPNYANAFSNRGLVWYNKLDFDKALNDLNKAIDIDPFNENSFGNRALVWQSKLEFDKALADYNMAIKLNHKYSIAYRNRGSLWKEKREMDKALADYYVAISLKSMDPSLYNNRGLIWYEKKEFINAVADYTKAIELKNNPIWRPLMNRSRAFKALSDQCRESNEFIAALEYVRKAIEDIDEAIKNATTEKPALEDDKKNLLELRKLINEAMNSQATIKQVNEMKEDVEATKKKIDGQAKETSLALKEVEDIRDRMKQQADQFNLLAQNVKEVETKFRKEEIEVKALETFFADTLKGFEAKSRKADARVLFFNVVLAVISIVCVITIAFLIKNNKEFLQNKSLMIYMISLTAIILTPLIWMLKLAIKKRNEILLLETEYRHKTALSSSLYSFKLTLGEMYTKDTTQLAFQTIFGNNPCDLLADDNSRRIKNKKEQDYPHATLEVLQKVIPEIVEKTVKAVMPSKEG